MVPRVPGHHPKLQGYTTKLLTSHILHSCLKKACILVVPEYAIGKDRFVGKGRQWLVRGTTLILILHPPLKWIESWIKLGAGNSSCPAESRTLQFGPTNSPLEKQLP